MEKERPDYSSPSLWLDLTAANDRIAELDAKIAQLHKENAQLDDDAMRLCSERDAANALLDEIGELPGGDDCETCKKVICIMQKRNESEGK